MSEQWIKKHRMTAFWILMGAIILLVLVAPPRALGQDANDKMIQATRMGDAAAVKELLSQGASVEAKDNLGNSALTCAVEDTQMECVAVLLENGAEVNTRSYNGYSPLILSTIKGQKKMARMLMENGADVNATDP